MSRSTRGLVVMLWVLSVAGAAVLGARVQAPAQKQEPPAPPVVVTYERAPLLSGPDLGFRVQRMERGRAVGTFVVKIGDEWVEVTSSPRMMPAR